MLNLISPLTARLVHANDKTFLDLLYRDSRADLLAIPLAPAAVQQMIAMQQMSQAMGMREAYPNAQHWLLLWDGEALGRLVIDVNDFEIVGGVPAKHIRYRFDLNNIQLINESNWWCLNIESAKIKIKELEIKGVFETN